MSDLILPGDAVIMIDGKERRLRLTLGALAHLEDHIGGGDIDQLFERLKSPTPADLLHLLAALLMGGGEKFTFDMLMEKNVSAKEAGRAIAAALRALAAERDGDDRPPDAPPAEEAPGKPAPRRDGDSPGSAGFATR